MSDIIMMMMSAAGAIVLSIAIAAVVLFAIGMLVSAVIAWSGGLATVMAAALPVVACTGGIAYAASKTGYGGT